MKKIILFITLVLFLNSCKDKEKAKEPETVPAHQIEMATAQPEEIEAGAEIVADNKSYVDLQAVTIDPIKPTIKKGSQTTVITNIKNNGPDDIPVGEARIHITVNGKFLYKPAGFKSNRWKLDTITKSSGGNYEIFIRNSTVMQMNEPGFPGFRFIVKGRGEGTADINLASTISSNSTSDIDGNNQSISTEVIVIKQ